MEQAAKLLSEQLNTHITLHAPQVIKNWERNCVVRCKIQGNSTNIGSSVILKQLKGDLTCGYSDWASLQFVSNVQGTDRIAPRLYGGEVEHSFFIMEDLGSSRTVEDILQGTDYGAAEKYFVDLVQKTARLHRMTQHKENEYLAIRAAFPMDTGHGRFHESDRWNAGLERVRTWFRESECPLPERVEPCLAAINTTFRNPGPFLTFTHGDMAPSNNHIAGDQVYLLDFEYGDFRHMLYDLTAWYMLCPLPEGLVSLMQDHYKKAMSSAFREFDADFDDHWNLICAWRGLAMLSWIPPAILQENRPWVGEWTMREAVLTALHRLQLVCSRVNILLPLAESVKILQQTLMVRWSEFPNGDCLPKWPVFQR